jgi:archaellum biogenesis ATPase FlaH
MKIQVKNLGPLTEAEFEVADLTIICGGNNTGKTYATYALFGFLHTWRKMLVIDSDDSVISALQCYGIASINIEKYIKQFQDIVDSACQAYNNEMPEVLATASEISGGVEFRMMVDAKDIEYWKSITYELITKSFDLAEPCSIIKKQGSLDIIIDLPIENWLIGFTDSNCWSWISGGIQDIIFSQFFPSVFIASVERTGISIFRREIDSSRNNLFEMMSKASTSDQKLNLFRSRYQDYSLPIQFGLNFNRLIGLKYKRSSFIAEEHLSILDDFTDIVGGEYHFNEYDEIYYSPKKSSKVRLSVSESSSSVRSLLDLGFYLRHQAQEGSLLIIDEPELNLHPENQRRIARLFARLVNIGIKVFITTHSDYIIKELNTLIMLNHEKPHLKKIAEEEGYKPEELIAAERIKVYIAENSTLVPANIDPEMGIEARSFDTTIEDMNRIQEAIVWGEE